MLKDVLSRVEKRLEAVGLRAAEASRLAGLSADAIRNMRRGAERPDERKGVSTRTIAALAPVLQTSAAWLLTGEGSETEDFPMSRIIGRVGANPDESVVYTTADDVWDVAPLPPGGTQKAVALEVVGHSMRSIADDGALIYFEDQRTPPTEDMIGYPAVVETEDGRVLVKRLLRGRDPDHFDLESVNGATISNVRLRWAAEITAIIPPKQARRIIRRADAA